jgi:hypothetical protein
MKFDLYPVQNFYPLLLQSSLTKALQKKKMAGNGEWIERFVIFVLV